MPSEQDRAESLLDERIDAVSQGAGSIDAEGALRRIRESVRASNDAALSEALEVPYPTIASWRRRKSIPLDVFISVSTRTGASLDWLILGRDEASQPPVVFNLSDAAFDYAVAFALVAKGIDARKFKDLPDLVRTFYTVVDGMLEALDRRGLQTQDDRRAELERHLARAISERVR